MRARRWAARAVLAALALWLIYLICTTRIHAENRLFWGGHDLTLAEFLAQVVFVVAAGCAAIGAIIVLVIEAFGGEKRDDHPR